MVGCLPKLGLGLGLLAEGWVDEEALVWLGWLAAFCSSSKAWRAAAILASLSAYSAPWAIPSFCALAKASISAAFALRVEVVLALPTVIELESLKRFPPTQ